MNIRPVLFLFLLYSGSSFAEFIGIDENTFRPHYRPQQQQMWCWASSAEMVLSYNGINLPQEAIVERIKGFRVNAGGSPMEMIKSVNAVMEDTNDESVVISGQFVMGAPLPTVLYNHLKQRKPVILTYQSSPYFGHAVVLTGIDVEIDGGNVSISKFYIFDPFAYRPVMDWRGNRLEYDSHLIYKQYRPYISFNGIRIDPGVITGVIFVDGTSL